MQIRLTVLCFLPHAMYLIVWTLALVFAVRIVRRGAGRSERLFLVGVCVMLGVAVVSAALAGTYTGLTICLNNAGYQPLTMAVIVSGIHLIVPVLSVLGIGFLVCSFWRKFRESDNAESAELRG